MVDFGGHDEVAFGEAVDLVGPESDLGFAPGEEDVGVMALLFGEGSDQIYEGEGLGEVREFERAMDMVVVGDRPGWNVLVQGFEFVALERRDAAAAGNALLVG